jgi:predicted PurR-regulated permease PerM
MVNNRNLIAFAVSLPILYLGRHILMPFAFGVLFAMLLVDPCSYLEKYKVPRGLSSLLSIILFACIGLILAWCVFSQLSRIKDGLSVLAAELSTGIRNIDMGLSGNTGDGSSGNRGWIRSYATGALPDSGSLLQGTFSFVSFTLASLLLIPVYTFLLLYYRGLFAGFLAGRSGKIRSDRVLALFSKARKVIRQYAGGLLIEMAIVATLNATGFFLMGIRYALLLAIIVALLNLIPYLGILIACILSLVINLHDGPPGIAFRVIVVLLSVHLLDAYIIYPKVVGSKVRINVLAVILGVVTGGTLWGIPGMFLALPAIAMFKVICNETEGLRAYGILLGDDRNRK